MIKYLVFTLILILLYLACNFAFSNIGSGVRTVMKISTRNPVVPGEMGYAVSRFKDVNSSDYRNIDMVFLGSSHCYRTFDTRIYAQQGLRAFNMGTTGQTPLNSYYLLNHYFEKLNPKLVVLELYYGVFDRDGLESFYDVSINAPYFPEMLDMAFAIQNPHAINGAISKWLTHLSGTDRLFPQQEMENQQYIAGGHVTFTKLKEKNSDTSDLVKPISRVNLQQTARSLHPLPEQLEYLEKTIVFVKENGAKVVLVTQPEPAQTVARTANYDEISATFSQIAEKHDVYYFDFNKRSLPLTLDDYYDKEYLNIRGTTLFNRAFIDVLREHQIIPAK